MQVNLALKEWKVVQDDKTKLPRLAGKYAIVAGDKEIAAQVFNGGYGEKDITFSPELTASVVALDTAIKAELEKLLS